MPIARPHFDELLGAIDFAIGKDKLRLADPPLRNLLNGRSTTGQPRHPKSQVRHALQCA